MQSWFSFPVNTNSKLISLEKRCSVNSMVLNTVTLNAANVVCEANGFTFVASEASSVSHNASNKDSNV